MQNLISDVTSNFEEFLSTNLGATTANVASKGIDFAKIFQNQAETKNKLDSKAQVETTQKAKNLKEVKSNHLDSRDEIKKRDFDRTETKNEKKTEDKHLANEAQKQENKVQTTDDKKQTEQTQTTTQDKTVEEIETKEVVKETQKVVSTEEKNVDIETTIKDTMEKISQAIENATDGKLGEEDVQALKAALEELQKQIDDNKLVVSEDTQKLIDETLNKLTSQDTKALEIKVLTEDLKQLQKDIAANAFKLNSQTKFEDESKKNATLTIDTTKQDTKAQTKTVDTQTQQVKTQTQEQPKTTQASVLVSNEVKDTQNVQKAQNSLENIVEQEMLDEMQVKVENVSTSTNTNAQGQNYSSTAQDEIAKLAIAKNSESLPQNVGANFNNNIQAANFREIQAQGVAKEINTNDVLNQIGSKFEQLKDGTQTRVTLTLRPHDLGRVTIELTQSANGITTNIIAQNSQIKEMLDKNIDILKQQLAQQGINVQNVQVKTVEQNAQTNTGNSFFNQEGQKNEQGFSQNSSNNGQTKQGQHQFNFNQANVIENVDFEGQNSQTAQINTAGGKISYNL